ncbi:BQ5605_C026g10139 [Microbotryum silenes-dioicae]|uniref:BQ5605_C026g10139 protein n=1 Tax=Microbotryum silenes-dioicae TaxID=796604 RepID=A0A2X0N8V9_9BASI|nr:BQ5605_C026g10139 [Microbotryum silenes-dioicae]
MSKVEDPPVTMSQSESGPPSHLAGVGTGSWNQAISTVIPVDDEPKPASVPSPSPTPAPVEAPSSQGDVKPLPVGNNVHPTTQQAHATSASESLVQAQADKVEQADRVAHGKPEKGRFVPGISDDRLWALRRRFDSQIVHVLSPPTKLPPGEPDLRSTTLPSVPFNSDLLRSNAERVYATAGVWSIYFAREMGRLMNWDEENRIRTGIWCTSYFLVCWCDFVIPTIMLLLILLVSFTPSRAVLFPPVHPPPGVPHSATDPTQRKGDESKIAGVGHPVEHRSKSEQIEQQAWEMTNTLQRFGARVVVGGQGKGKRGNATVGRKQGADEYSDSSDDEEDSEDDEAEVPAAGGKEGEVVVVGPDGQPEKKMTAKEKRKKAAREAKKKRDEKVGRMAKGLQDGLGDFADALERFANAVSPPRPYPHTDARYKLAGAILVPILLVTAIVPAHVWSRVSSVSFGIGFFGQPLLKRAGRKFVELVPDWQEKLDLRNSILSKVPTNAQLTLHMLRVKEAAYNPLPPPPTAPTPAHVKAEIEKTADVDDSDELPDKSAKHVDSKTGETDTGADEDEGGDGGAGVRGKVVKKSKKGLLGGLKLMAKKAATFHADVTVDGKAKLAKGVDKAFFQSRVKDRDMIERFPAKFEGSSGELVITHEFGQPALVSFVPASSLNKKTMFERPIDDLVEVKKSGVWIGRAVLGWAAGASLEGAGLELRFKDAQLREADSIGKQQHEVLGEVNPHDEQHEGDTVCFSHVVRRDQFFARLISIPQNTKWETL